MGPENTEAIDRFRPASTRNALATTRLVRGSFLFLPFRLYEGHGKGNGLKHAQLRRTRRFERVAALFYRWELLIARIGDSQTWVRAVFVVELGKNSRERLYRNKFPSQTLVAGDERFVPPRL